MRKLFTTGWLILLFNHYSYSQNTIIDSIRIEVQKAKHDTDKAIQLYRLSYYYQNYKPDSALQLAQKAYELSKEKNFLRGLNGSLGMIALAYKKMGNFPRALETYLEQLKILEKKNDTEELAGAYLSIALVHSGNKDYSRALVYARKADSIARANHLNNLYLYTTLDLGDIYSKDNQLDSALYYTILSYQASLESHAGSITGTALNNMGNIYLKSGKIEKAIESFRSSIPFLEEVDDQNTLSECFLGLSQSFDKLEKTDSALYYARRSFAISSEHQFIEHAIHGSQLLTALYKKQHRIDSAFAYQEKYISMKDSFSNSEKIRELQVLTMNEQFRQDEIAREKLRESKQRLFKLEFLLIGMLIPVFFFLSAYISRKKVHKRVIELSGIFSLIFLFEYITLLIHPYVKEKANHSPVYEIIFFVAIAAILSPTHHKVEYWLISKLTRKHHQKSMPLHS